MRWLLAPMCWRAAQYNRAGAVAENNNRSAIRRIAGARQHIGANNQRIIYRAVLHILIIASIRKTRSI